MTVHRASRRVPAPPEAVHRALVDPASIARWAAVPFEVLESASPTFGAGTSARVAGRLAGVPAAFDVDVTESDATVLALRASGPVSFDVRYALAPAAAGTDVRATVRVQRGAGLTGRALAVATHAMLDGGALSGALARLSGEAQRLHAGTAAACAPS